MANAAVHPIAVPFWAWFVLAGVVLVCLLVDLLAHRGTGHQGRKWAIFWSVAWIALALLFCGWVAFQFGAHKAQEYLTAYIIEKSLSVDNLFVFLLIFGRLRIPKDEQYRVLRWGILGALVTRAIFITSGTALLASWHWLVYGLGIFLIYTGIRAAFVHAENAAGSDGKVLNFIRRHVPLTRKLVGHHFVVRRGGRWLATPLLVALLVIEFTDIVFAFDSIPTVFAVSLDPFIVYSSNVFAVLGLRALYLVLADLLAELKYLQYGLAAILVFAGAKMLTSSLFHIPHLISLAVIIAILAATIIPSVIVQRRAARKHEPARPKRAAQKEDSGDSLPITVRLRHGESI